MDVKAISTWNLEYADEGASGIDLKADIEHNILIPAHEWRLITTGLRLEIPQGFEGQIRSRSGLALKEGIHVLNSPGTIDASYRGEIGVILHNVSNKMFVVEPGMRIAQLVFAPIVRVELKQVNQLSKTERGASGYGSTGLK